MNNLFLLVSLFVSFNIDNMFPSNDNNRGNAAVKSAFDSIINLSPSTECIIEVIEICLTNNNSTFTGQNLIQTNGTTVSGANSCSYLDLTIQPIDNAV